MSKAILRARACHLYREGMPQIQIAEQLGVSEKTICQWKEQGEWEERRYGRLIEHEPEWALRLLTLLVQQLQEQQIQNQLIAIGAPPPPAPETKSKRKRKSAVKEIAEFTNMAQSPK
ncbi:helix-turn-helix domain-containing protein [Hymenobacter sp. BT175]|uniref:helix-turn-helix domain-containing protein n=1 Tax=Hymenobacter translucens TaxID=2886507 RepID=UPI001D0EF9CE|nr:helix-turn-helix domain-containing protein [Hymenobacter translucens]MCC2545476.1 helix-turn-helix domain-containing protein [Hymenobacter translucens]